MRTILSFLRRWLNIGKKRAQEILGDIRGFALVELLVVIVIVGLIIATIFLTANTVTKKTELNDAKQGVVLCAMELRRMSLPADLSEKGLSAPNKALWKSLTAAEALHVSREQDCPKYGRILFTVVKMGEHDFRLRIGGANQDRTDNNVGILSYQEAEDLTKGLKTKIQAGEGAEDSLEDLQKNGEKKCFVEVFL